MTSDEIEQLKDRIKVSVPERQNQEDEMLAAMSYQPGWEVFKTRIEKKINVLLEPGVDSKDLAFVGAVTMARELAIEVLRGCVSDVESAKAVSKKVSDTVQE